MKSVLRKENLDDNAKIVPIILNLRNFNEINKLIFESWSNFTAEFVICSKETESLGIKSIKKKIILQQETTSFSANLTNCWKSKFNIFSHCSTPA